MSTFSKDQTQQLFIPEGITCRLHRQDPYVGRAARGVSHSDDGRLDVNFLGSRISGSGTNPSSCLRLVGPPVSLVAMGLVANRMKVTLPADVAIDAEIDLCHSGDVYFLRARLNVQPAGFGARSRPSSCRRHARRDVCIFQRYAGQHRGYAQPGVSRILQQTLDATKEKRMTLLANIPKCFDCRILADSGSHGAAAQAPPPTRSKPGVHKMSEHAHVDGFIPSRL